jgi:putative transposase
MARTARASVGDVCYHVLNRSNGRDDVFHKKEDYVAFLDLIEQAQERLPMRLLAWCLMPNHFHLILWPHNDGDLSRWMQWLMTSHVRRYHRHYHGSGHVWQGRFKAFPIEEDEHLWTVLRYVERNALRARLVRRAENWPWSSSAAWNGGKRAGMLHPGPLLRKKDWLDWVNRPQSEAELATLRKCIARGTPYGEASWQRATATRLGLESSLRPRGRPRLPQKK